MISGIKSPVMTELRRAERRQVSESGKIILLNCSFDVIDCLIRNMSSRGACLEVPSQYDIPSTFALIIGAGNPIACKVAWRQATRIGVRFG
jgi:hypothetical protein